MRDWIARIRDSIDRRLPYAQERRWVDATRAELRFLADLGLRETDLKYYVSGPEITFEGQGRGLSLMWDADGTGDLFGEAWRDPDRVTRDMIHRLIRRRFPDAPLPPPDIRDLEVALAATRLLASQLAQVLPSFYAGRDAPTGETGDT